MKLRRFLSSLLFGLGCALAFVGLLALILPAVSNDQLKLVLASFAMPSDNAAVSLINRLMSFALEQSWRVLALGIIIAGAGAWLLVRFTPVKHTAPLKPMAEPPSASQTSRPACPASSQPAVTQADEPPNPFAVPVRSVPPVQPGTLAVHPAPILEPNRIRENEPQQQKVPDVQEPPFAFPRLAVEANAIAAEAGVPSQSGSRILVRSAYERPPVTDHSFTDEPEPVPSPVLEAPAKAEPVSPAQLTPPPPLSPRIRSTMGRHGTRNLPASHP